MSITEDQDTLAAHNARVAQWVQIAKPVISSPNTDLILLPHNLDNSISYDSAGGLIPYVAHSGAVQDVVSGGSGGGTSQLFPIVNTSVTFGFGSVSADASPGTNSDFASAGYGSDASANNGVPFVPSVYTATAQSWAYPYHISLYQYTNTAQPLFDTQLASMTAAASMYAAGDLLEMYYDSGANPPLVPVYDVSSGVPIGTGSYANKFVPMVVNPDSATINFSTPALPTPSNPYNRFFWVPIADIAANGQIDLSALTNSMGQTTPQSGGPAVSPIITAASTTVASPLQPVTLDGSAPPAPSGSQVFNARIVPGSVRVFGPDALQGPNYGNSVAYSEAFAGNTSTTTDDQFQVDYGHNFLQVNVADLANVVSAGQAASPAVVPAIGIAFDYQSNMAPTDPSSGGAYANPISAGNPASPLLVKVDYQTRDLIDINLGVRVYDPNNVGPADVVTVRNQVRVGNSNR